MPLTFDEKAVIKRILTAHSTMGEVLGKGAQGTVTRSKFNEKTFRSDPSDVHGIPIIESDGDKQEAIDRWVAKVYEYLGNQHGIFAQKHCGMRKKEVILAKREARLSQRAYDAIDATDDLVPSIILLFHGLLDSKGNFQSFDLHEFIYLLGKGALAEDFPDIQEAYTKSPGLMLGGLLQDIVHNQDGLHRLAPTGIMHGDTSTKNNLAKEPERGTIAGKEEVLRLHSVGIDLGLGDDCGGNFKHQRQVPIAHVSALTNGGQWSPIAEAYSRKATLIQSIARAVGLDDVLKIEGAARHDLAKIAIDKGEGRDNTSLMVYIKNLATAPELLSAPPEVQILVSSLYGYLTTLPSEDALKADISCDTHAFDAAFDNYLKNLMVYQMSELGRPELSELEAARIKANMKPSDRVAHDEHFGKLFKEAQEIYQTSDCKDGAAFIKEQQGVLEKALAADSPRIDTAMEIMAREVQGAPAMSARDRRAALLAGKQSQSTTTAVPLERAVADDDSSARRRMILGGDDGSLDEIVDGDLSPLASPRRRADATSVPTSVLTSSQEGDDEDFIDEADGKKKAEPAKVESRSALSRRDGGHSPPLSRRSSQGDGSVVQPALSNMYAAAVSRGAAASAMGAASSAAPDANTIAANLVQNFGGLFTRKGGQLVINIGDKTKQSVSADDSKHSKKADLITALNNVFGDDVVPIPQSSGKVQYVVDLTNFNNLDPAQKQVLADFASTPLTGASTYKSNKDGVIAHAMTTLKTVAENQNLTTDQNYAEQKQRGISVSR